MVADVNQHLERVAIRVKEKSCLFEELSRPNRGMVGFQSTMNCFRL